MSDSNAEGNIVCRGPLTNVIHDLNAYLTDLNHDRFGDEKMRCQTISDLLNWLFSTAYQIRARYTREGVRGLLRSERKYSSANRHSLVWDEVEPSDTEVVIRNVTTMLKQ